MNIGTRSVPLEAGENGERIGGRFRQGPLVAARSTFRWFGKLSRQFVASPGEKSTPAVKPAASPTSTTETPFSCNTPLSYRLRRNLPSMNIFRMLGILHHRIGGRKDAS